MNIEKGKRIEQIISDLFYQTRIGIHTYSPCDCGRASSRGGNTCSLCLMEQLEEEIRDGIDLKVLFHETPDSAIFHKITCCEKTTGMRVDRMYCPEERMLESRFRKVDALQQFLLELSHKLRSFLTEAENIGVIPLPNDGQS